MDRETLWRHLAMDTPRARRAHRFAAGMIGLMRDFLPQDRECIRRIEEHLLEAAFMGNTEIISVPPEWDELNKLQLERALLEAHPLYISADKLLDRE